MSSLKRNRVFLGFWLLFFNACSMLSTQEPVRELPKSLMTFFAQPEKVEGSGAIKIVSSDGLVFSGQGDFVQKDNILETELYDPIGRTVLRGSYSDKGLQVLGTMSKSFAKVTIDQAGFLVFDGYFIGLKINELVALLQLRLPRAWLLLPKTLRKYDSISAYVFTDKPRRIFARLDKTGQVLDLEVTWTAMLGLIEKKIGILCDKQNSRLEVQVGTFAVTWELFQDDDI